MFQQNKVYNQLAIVGNGFDLQHGYKTSFKDFSQYLASKKEFENRLNEYLRLLNKYIGINNGFNSKEKWYDFELIAREMVNGFSCAERCAGGFSEFINNYTTYKNPPFDKEKFNREFEEICSDVDEYNELFNLIIVEMKKYLTIATKERCNLLKGVENVISEKTYAISFNYTETISRYNCDVLYVHGTLKEDDIVLGYDAKDMNLLDFERSDNQVWDKNLCRERLDFARNIKKDNLAGDKTREKKEFFLEFQKRLISPRGIDYSELIRMPFADEILKHSERVKTEQIDYNTYGINKDILKNIREIVVLGHGIESDEKYLDALLKLCNLNDMQQVIIFVYERESSDSLFRKMQFFMRHGIAAEKIRIGVYRV